MSKISFSIQYAGLTLPVIKNEQGEDCTPLKPIFDLFGLRWRDQRKKLKDSEFLTRHLGITYVKNDPENSNSGGDIPTSNTQKRTKNAGSGEVIPTSNPTYLPEVLIRVDRVAAYLLTINPDKVRAAGNVNGATFLEAKNSEWADALHDYEEIGVAINMNHIKQQEQMRKTRMALVQVIGVQNKTAGVADRRVVGTIIQQMAKELGIAYQPDLIE